MGYGTIGNEIWGEDLGAGKTSCLKDPTKSSIIIEAFEQCSALCSDVAMNKIYRTYSNFEPCDNVVTTSNPFEKFNDQLTCLEYIQDDEKTKLSENQLQQVSICLKEKASCLPDKILKNCTAK